MNSRMQFFCTRRFVRQFSNIMLEYPKGSNFCVERHFKYTVFNQRKCNFSVSLKQFDENSYDDNVMTNKNIENEEDIEEFKEHMVKTYHSYEYKCHKDDILNFINFNISYGGLIQDIYFLVKADPDVLKIPLSRYECFLNIFLCKQFSIHDCLKIFTRYPDILQYDENTLNTAVENIMNLSFPNFKKLVILVAAPEIISVDINSLYHRINYLDDIFRKRLTKVLLRNLTLLTGTEIEFKEILNFLQNDIEVTLEEIVESGAFNLSFENLKIRFEFLKKAGLLKKPGKKDLIQKITPSLEDICELEEKVFLTKSSPRHKTGLGLTEFNLFKEIYEREKRIEREIDDEKTEFVGKEQIYLGGRKKKNS